MYGWGRWCAWFSVGACPLGAWEQWRWRVLRAGSVGLLLRRCILVEVRTLLCGAYSGCGWVPPYLCVWSGHLAAGRFLRAVVGGSGYGWAHGGVCSVRGRAQWPRGVFCVRLGSLVCVFIFGRVFGGCLGVVVLACSVRGLGWGLAAWCVFCARLRVYPVCYEVDNSPLFNFSRIFPPFSRSVPKPCAETSYLRVQCLLGRADVWSARAVGATILDVFGYGLPTESGVGSQWRYCYCRGRKVGHPSENGMNSLGKFAFIPSSHLKI